MTDYGSIAWHGPVVCTLKNTRNIAVQDTTGSVAKKNTSITGSTGVQLSTRFRKKVTILEPSNVHTNPSTTTPTRSQSENDSSTQTQGNKHSLCMSLNTSQQCGNKLGPFVEGTSSQLFISHNYVNICQTNSRD